MLGYMHGTFVEDDLVTEDLDFDAPVRSLYQSGEDLAHGLGAGLYVHCADAQDSGRPDLVRDGGQVGVGAIRGGRGGPGSRGGAGGTLGRVDEGTHGDAALPAADLVFVHVDWGAKLERESRQRDAWRRHPAEGGGGLDAAEDVVVCREQEEVDQPQSIDFFGRTDLDRWRIAVP